MPAKKSTRGSGGSRSHKSESPSYSRKGMREAVEEIIEQQSKEAQEFYEEFFKKTDREEQKKEARKYWDALDRRMRAQMTCPQISVTVFDPEVQELRRELYEIFKRYKKTFRGKELEELKNAFKKYVKGLATRDETIKVEIAMAKITRALLRCTLDEYDSKPKRKPQKKPNPKRVLRDLQRIYSVCRRLAMRTGEIPTSLAVIEAEALRALAARNIGKVIERQYYLDTGITRVQYFNGYTRTSMYPLKKIEFTKRIRREVKPKISILAMHLLQDENSNGKGNRTKIRLTTIGSKDHFDYPFRSDYIGYMENGRIAKIELNRALSAEESLNSFEYGEVA